LSVPLSASLRVIFTCYYHEIFVSDTSVYEGSTGGDLVLGLEDRSTGCAEVFFHLFTRCFFELKLVQHSVFANCIIIIIIITINIFRVA